MKKLVFTITLSILASFVIFIQALSAPQLQVAVNGQKVYYPDEQPYIDDASNRTMVPARFVTEKLGAKVQWNGQWKQVTFTYKDQIITLTIGQNYAKVNGKVVGFDAPALIKNDRTMVPLRFISEMFGADVDWNGDRNLAVVTTSAHLMNQKGTWIWDAQIMKKDQEEILQFAQENGLTTLYLHIDRDIKPGIYQDFIRNANSRNIQIEALSGKPYWAFREYQSDIKEFIQWVKNYNASVNPNERFIGLHLDIEPYILEAWKMDQKRVLDNWMDNMRFIEEETRGTGLKITVDVPFWIYRTKIPGSDYTFSSWLLEKFDRLVIMDYRNFALGNNGIVSNANPIIKEASNLNKQAIVAVETAPNTEGDGITFYSLSTDTMEVELHKAKNELSRFSSFAGFAIHDYHNWMKMNK